MSTGIPATREQRESDEINELQQESCDPSAVGHDRCTLVPDGPPEAVPEEDRQGCQSTLLRPTAEVASQTGRAAATH